MNNTIDQQFIEYIVKSLVGNPDAVKVERRIDEKGVLLELTVDAEDLGRVIGKRGATAQSLRTLLRALGTKNDARYNLKIIDNGEPRPSQGNNDQHAADDNGAPADEPAAAPDDTASASQDDSAGAVDDAASSDVTPQDLPEDDDVLAKTRKELEELDDLDV